MAIVSDVVKVIETLAPPALAEGWDQTGLQVGDGDWPVDKALLCIDLTEAVLDEAIRQRASFVLAYHPLCFKPLARLTTQDVKQRIALRAATNQIAVYSPHTALDAAPAGVNDWLAAGLAPGSDGVVVPIRPVGRGQTQVKLVTFVPAGEVDKIRNAMAQLGAGQIGGYSHCSYMLEGVGTFLGGASTNPAVGRRGLLEKTPEVRLEMVAPADRLAVLLEVLRQVHPYEEPAFDVYPLIRTSGDGVTDDSGAGQGRVVQLAEPITLSELTQRLIRRLGVDSVEVSRPAGVAMSASVQRIGLCVGAGGSLLAEAGRLDAFITGEMRHHDILDATSHGVAILLAGHTQTERPYLKVLRQRLADATGAAVAWRLSRSDRAPGERVAAEGN